MYADDLVLLAQNECDLQKMLNTVGEWCTKLGMKVNPSNSDVIFILEKDSSVVQMFPLEKKKCI